MQLVLLSGGSGARLWPLSNNSRSKQFLPLFEREDGLMESMLQRVVRQVNESHLTRNILITTTPAQRDNIINQLGDEIEIISEPERRNTYAAIALMASYLYDRKACSIDEVVVVMPCDPFTDPSYYDTVKKMVDAVNENVADLILMGIRPSVPSSKYGYFIPEYDYLNTPTNRIETFEEKPSEARALELMRKGAMWNGGVFAFRLKYMLDLLVKTIGTTDFNTVRSQYGNFPKVSFDCEVVEKERSMAYVPFYGEWKDLGSWNILTSKLKHTTVGNVVVGQNNENTHVINELGIPVFIEGLKDTVVAACPDGILVSAKGQSDNVRNYSEELISRPMYEERRWGTYRVIDDTTYSNGSRSLTKSIIIKAGKSISYQIHHHRDEIWTFVDGEGLFVLDGKVVKVYPGKVVHIQKEHLHAVKAVSDLTFIEVQTGNPLIEEDIERFEFDWESAAISSSLE